MLAILQSYFTTVKFSRENADDLQQKIVWPPSVVYLHLLASIQHWVQSTPYQYIRTQLTKI